MKTSTFILPIILTLFYSQSYAQYNTTVPLIETDYAYQTFNGLHVINGHSVETLEKSSLGFYIGHRFGEIASGYQSFFGLDEYALWRIGLDYGITDDLTIGGGRSSANQLHDIYVKYKLLHQSSGKVNMPVTITAMGRMGITSKKFNEVEKKIFSFKHRLNYAVNLGIARQFGSKISLQFTSFVLHENLTEDMNQNNTSVALGGAFKWKFSNTASVVTEYYHNMSYQLTNGETYYGNFAIGVDLTTSSHNFSIILTNNIYMIENQFIPYNGGEIFGGGLHIGFNISRNFLL